MPSWVVAALLLLLAWRALGVPAWVAGLVFAAYVAKDLALYPAMSAVFRPPVPAVAVGQRATAVERLAPVGYVRVRGELWQARCRSGEAAPGDAVVVRELHDLTLIVEPAATDHGSR